MAKRKCPQPARGPRRKPASVVKLRCFYGGCRNVHVDCKNKPFTAPPDTLTKRQLRKLRPQTVVARFCSQEHLSMCRATKASKQGGREPLTTTQAVQLFQVLRSVAPWAAVLYLLALFTGERVGAACRACTAWFSGMDPQVGDPPRLRIPRVNLKTSPRQIALLADFAQLLWSWVHKQPLAGGTADCSKQWPFPEQTLSFAEAPRRRLAGKRACSQLLFPGRDPAGRGRRLWHKPITEKAFYNAFVAAQGILRLQRNDAHARGESHSFDDVVLERLTSHSCKKTAATLLSQHASMAVVAAITGTTSRILLERYVCPTSDLQRKAVNAAFVPLVEGVQQAERPASHEGSSAGGSSASLGYCTQCSLKQKSFLWRFCPACGAQYETVPI